MKSGTDLYSFQKDKVTPSNLTFSPDDKFFVTIDTQVKIWNTAKHKIIRIYDESDVAGNSDDMEIGKRAALEKELAGSSARIYKNVCWDFSGNFILYASSLGIKGTTSRSGFLAKLIRKQWSIFILIRWYDFFASQKYQQDSCT